MSDKDCRHVEEQLIEAETSLEEAIMACDDARLTGEMLGEYRDVVLTLTRLRGGQNP